MVSDAMGESSTPTVVTGIEDDDMETMSTWTSLPLPTSGPGSARLSFDALAKLFAAQRTSLIDADPVSVDTRTLLSDRGLHEKAPREGAPCKGTPCRDRPTGMKRHE
jgi:hypothetical protein